MATPKKVDPSGLPRCRSGTWFGDPSGTWPSRWVMAVLSRNSCVTAMPMDAKAREVRSQARKVRSRNRRLASFASFTRSGSIGRCEWISRGVEEVKEVGDGHTNLERDDPSPHCPCYPTRRSRNFPPTSPTNLPLHPRPPYPPLSTRGSHGSPSSSNPLDAAHSRHQLPLPSLERSLRLKRWHRSP